MPPLLMIAKSAHGGWPARGDSVAPDGRVYARKAAAISAPS
jgi:hypothetical protein